MNLGLAVTAAIQKTQREGTNRSKKDSKRLLYLRPSGFHFNYCQLRTFFACREALHGSTHTLMDFSKSYFTKMGTTSHEVFQEALFRSGVEALHDWVCTRCKTRYRMKESIKKCSTCWRKGVRDKPTFEREEIEIDYLGVLGHIDCVLKVKDREGKVWYVVVDLKSTSAAALPKKKKDPGDNYLAQIQTYTLVLKELGLPIKGWALVFFTRDNPFKFEVVSGTEIRISKKELKLWGKLHREALNATSLKEVLLFAEHRICRSREDVEKKMGSCPHAVKCIHGDAECKKHVKADFKQMAGKLPVIQWLSQT